MDEKTLEATALELIENKQYTKLKAFLKDQNPYDVASLMEEINDVDLTLVFRILPKDNASEIFSNLPSEIQEKLINSFSENELRKVLDELFLDDTVDLIEEMPANVVSRILKNTDPQTRKRINEVLNYPDDSAGSLMTIEYVFFAKDMTVAEAMKKIRQVGFVKETIYTCYVTEFRKLIGTVELLDLITADEDAKIEDIMDTNVIYVNTHDDQEEVANSMRKYDLMAIPVVDNENRIVGIITVDDIIDVIHEETTEDIQKMAGISPTDESYFNTSVFSHAKSRIPWLLFLMLSATLSGAVINHYESLLVSIPILFSFVPMLTGTGGNCGSQSSTIVIRSLAMDEIEFKDFFKVMFKEFRIALLVSFVLAAVNGVRIWFVYRNDADINSALLGFVIGLSIIATVILAKTVGCVLPMIAKKLHFDPAIMAAPLISTIVDACSVFLYCNIAIKIFDILG